MAARLLILLVLCCALPCASAGAAISIGEKQEAQLKAGEVLVEVHVDEDKDAAAVSAVIDIPAQREKVWAIMIDCGRAPHFVPDLKSCRVLERDPKGAWDVREHIIDWTWFLPNIRNVFRSDYVPPHILRFARVDGDMRLSEGVWRLEPINGGGTTRLFYDALLSPRSWIPASMALPSVREDVPKILRALRRECTDAQ